LLPNSKFAVRQPLTSPAAPKKPVKKLPTEVEISPDATVEDVKVLIAKAVGLADHHRIGLFDLETKKTLKDRQARISDIPAVVSAGELSVKDLGTSWPC
jgi:very-long-chain enoyl-CoA reductase